MRDYFLTLFVFAMVPVCVARPWIGILMWYWLGLMNPHRLTWDFAYTMPFAMAIGLATLFGALFARDRRPIPWQREMVLLVILFAYFCFTTLFAWVPSFAWIALEKLAKIVFMTFVATMFIYGKQRIRALMLVMVFSIGYYGIKGGVWSIMTGGAEQVLGPEGSFIEGNTFIALALNMVIPVMVALAQDECEAVASLRTLRFGRTVRHRIVLHILARRMARAGRHIEPDAAPRPMESALRARLPHAGGRYRCAFVAAGEGVHARRYDREL